jgi:hypothetical protein
VGSGRGSGPSADARRAWDPFRSTHHTYVAVITYRGRGEQIRWTPKAQTFLPAWKTKTRKDRTLPTQLQAIDLHFHDPRREAGSRWLDGGVPLHQIQDWIGHTNISQTSTYLAVTDEGGNAAMARFEAARAQQPASEAERSSEILQTVCNQEGEKWSGREDSNLRLLGPEPSALPG